MSMESLDEVSGVTLEFDEDEDLVSKGTEPDSWSVTAEKKVHQKEKKCSQMPITNDKLCSLVNSPKLL